MIRGVALILLFFGLSFASVQAQSFVSTDPLTLVVSPAYPRPFQTVSISPRSTLIDLSASVVRVSVDGTEVYEGSGTRPVSITTGAVGQKTRVTVQVTAPDGQVYTKEQLFRPAEVSLVVEPESTSHPFYQGGSLVASEGLVRLVAIPDFRTNPATPLAAENLVYTWRHGDRILTDASGIGRSTLIARAPVRFRTADITVTVTSRDSTLVGEAQVRIAATDPVMRIYRNDPLLGTNFDVALPTSYTMTDTEATFRAIGYFFANSPSLSWSVNGAMSGTDRDITVRSTGVGQGSARISVSGTDNTRRTAAVASTVQFGQATGFGFFGL